MDNLALWIFSKRVNKNRKNYSKKHEKDHKIARKDNQGNREKNK